MYIIDVEYPLPEGVPDDKVLDAVAKLLDVHPVLRSRIVLKDGSPWFSVDAQPVITVSGSPVEDIRRPFVLSESLSRFHVVSGKCVQAAFHHTVSDGLTAGIVWNTLQRIIEGEVPDTDLGFLRDSSFHSSSDISASEDFFRSMLSDVSGDTVPVEDPDGTFGSGSLELGSSIEAIYDTAKRMGATPANLLASAFGYMLSRFTGSPDAVFAHIVNGRDLTGSEDSAGMFVRTLPVALDCRDRSVREFVTQSSERIFGTISNQLCPFHRIANEMGVSYGIVFNHFTGIEKHADAVRPGMKENDIVGDLIFELIQDRGRYVLSYLHSSKYSASTVGRMTAAFDAIVTGLISCGRLSEIDYTPKEDIPVLDAINDT